MTASNASGSLMLHVGLNDADAMKELKALKAQVRSNVNEMKSTVTELQTTGQATEAYRTKIEMLTSAVEKQEEYIKRASAMIKNSSDARDVDNLTIERQTSQLNSVKAAMARNNAEIAKAQTYLTRYESGVVEAVKANKLFEEQSTVTAKQLLLDGSATEQLQQKKTALTTKINNLKDIYEKENAVLLENKKSLDVNKEALREQQLRVDKSKLAWSQALEEQRLYISGTERLATKIKDNDAITNSYLTSLRNESKTFSANATELSILKNKRDLLSQQYAKEESELKLLAERNGTATAAYSAQAAKLADLRASYTATNAKVEDLNKKVGGTSAVFNSFGDKLEKNEAKLKAWGTALGNISKASAVMSVGIGVMVKQGLDTASTLQNDYIKINNLIVTSNNETTAETHKNMAKMKADAKSLSDTYGISQTKIADGYEDLIKRGYTSAQAVGAQKDIVKTATAANEDLGTVTGITSQTMEAFGMTLDKHGNQLNNATEMTKRTKAATNELAYAADMTSSNFQDLGIGMSYVSNIAHQAGFSLAETSSAMGILSNNGLEADKAGTGLRKTLNSLIAPTKNGIAALKEIGLETSDFVDSSGKLKSMSDIFGEINSHMGSLTKNQRTDFFHAVFGTTGQNAAGILANNAQRLKTLTGEVKDSVDNDYVGKLAKKNMNSVKSQEKIFKESFKNLQTSLAQSLLPQINGALKQINKFVHAFDDMPKWGQNVVAGVAIGIPAFTIVTGAIAMVLRNAKTAWGWIGKLFSWRSKDSEGEISAINEVTLAIDDQTQAVKLLTDAWKEEHSIASEDTVGTETVETTGGSKGAKTEGKLASKESTSDIISGELENTEKKVAESGTKSSSTFLSKFREGMSLSKSKLFGLGKSNFLTAGIFSAISDFSGSSSIGSKFKNTLVDTLGAGAGGTLGGYVGGALGTVFGPVGAAAGTFLGSTIGQFTGQGVANYVKKHPHMWDSVVSSIDHVTDTGSTAKKTKTVKLSRSEQKSSQSVGNLLGKMDALSVKIGFTTDQKSLNAVQAKMDKVYADLLKKSNDSVNKRAAKEKQYLQQQLKDGNISQAQYNNLINNLNKADSQRVKKNQNTLNQLKANNTTFSKQIESLNNSHQQTLTKIQNSAAKKRTANSKEEQRLLAIAQQTGYIEIKGKVYKGEAAIAAVKNTYSKKETALEKSTQDKIKAEDSSNSVARQKIISDFAQNRLAKEKKLGVDIAGTMTSSSKKQKAIYKEMVDSKGKMSDQELGKLLQNSAKQTNQQINDADKTYKQTKKSAEDKANSTIEQANWAYKNISGYSKSQRDAAISEAKTERDGTIKAAKDKRDNTVATAKDLNTKVKNQAEDESKGVTQHAVKEGENGVWTWRQRAGGIGEVINGIVKWLNKFFKMFGGSQLSSVSGMPNGQPSFSTLGYASGGKIDSDIVSLVGEAGPELVYRPYDKKVRIVGANGPTFAPLSAGEQVLNAQDTAKVMSGSYGNILPGYASGNSSITSFLSGMVKNAENFVGTISDDMQNILDKPKEWIDGFFKKVTMDGTGDFGNTLLTTIHKQIEKGVTTFFGKINDSFGDAGGNSANPSGSSVKRWKDDVIRALRANGLSTSSDMVARVLRQISTESGGNPHAKQPGADPDGDGSGPALGLMQTKRSTFNANKFPGHGDLWNGYDDILAGLRYAKKRYGPSLSFLGRGHGYENGGWINQNQLIEVAEKNKPEVVLPVTNKSRSYQLIGEALDYMGDGKSNSSSSSSNNNYQDKMLSNAEQLVSLLTQLLGINTSQLQSMNSANSNENTVSKDLTALFNVMGNKQTILNYQTLT